MPRTPAWPAIAVLLTVAVAGPVAGHAIFRSSTPGNGALLDEAPEVVDVTFDEAIVEIRLAQVLDGDGRRVDAGPATIDGDDPTTIHVPVGNATDGLYTVRWAVASEDAHNVSGAFFFVVGDEMPTRQQLIERADAGGQASSLDVAEPPLRALVTLAAAAIIGLAATGLVAVGPTLGDPDRETTALTVAAALLAVGALLLAWRRLTRGDPPDGVLAVLAGPTGIGAVGPLAGAAVAGAATRLRPARRRGLALVGGLAAVATLAPASHSAATGGSAGLAVDVGHLVAAGLWPGGVAALAVLAPDLADARPEVAADLVGRFSLQAIAAVGLGAATGLAMAAWHVPSPAAWTSTLYGGSLIVKVLIAGSALLVGAYHRLVLRPRLADGSRSALDRFASTLRGEAGLLVAVLVVSAVMTSAATGVAALAARDEGPIALDDRFHHSGGLDGERVSTWIDVSLRATPGTSGLNAVEVEITRDGAPVTDVDRVRLDPTLLDRDVDLPATDLTRDGPGAWSTVTALPLPGTWSLGLEVQVNGTLHEVLWTTATRDVETVPDRSLQTPSTALAVASGLLAAVAALWERRG